MRLQKRSFARSVLFGLGLAGMVAVGPWGDAANASAKRGGVYTVKAGDTLSTIATRFRCNVNDLRRVNGLKRDLIRSGQKLKIPGNDSAFRGKRVVHVVKPGDSLGRIARDYGTTVSLIRRDNPRVKGDKILIGQRLRIRASIPHRKQRRFVYTIEAGDTLSGIGAKFGVSWPDIAQWNPRKDPKRLRVGSRLTVYLDDPKVRSTTTGRPQRGRLLNGEQLPDGPGYRRQSPRRAWGTNETITQILRVIAELRTKHPKIHDVLIGDISKKGGGKLLHHVSHQSGRDVDIGFVFKHLPPEGPTRFLRLRHHKKNIDYEASWSLITSLVGSREETSKVQHIFLSYREQQIMYDWAVKRGIPKRQLDYVFQYPRGRRALAGKIRHVKGHTGHMHVRFKCPPKDMSCLM